MLEITTQYRDSEGSRIKLNYSDYRYNLLHDGLRLKLSQRFLSSLFDPLYFDTQVTIVLLLIHNYLDVLVQ